MTIVKSKIIKIGNSRGLRIPKILLKQLNIRDEVELEIQAGQLIIRAMESHRKGWASQFEQMAINHDDRLLDDAPNLTHWDDDEWEW